MTNLFSSLLISSVIFIPLGCASSLLETDSNTIETVPCSINPNVLTSGQVRYFKEMDMKVSSCEGIQGFRGAPDSGVIAVIFSALGIDYEVSDYMFVDVQFYGTRLTNGLIEISHIEKAELTENSIFDPSE